MDFSFKKFWRDSESPGPIGSCAPLPRRYTRSCQFQHIIQTPAHNHTLTHLVTDGSCDDPGPCSNRGTT